MDKNEIVKMNLFARLIEAEGFSDVSYADGRDRSIGYGHNITQLGLPSELAKRAEEGRSLILSIAEAESLLRGDIELFTGRAEAVVPGFSSLSPARQEVVIEMMFNLGETRFRGFERMLSGLAAEDYVVAADEIIDSRYHRDKRTQRRAKFLADKMRRG